MAKPKQRRRKKTRRNGVTNDSPRSAVAALEPVANTDADGHKACHLSFSATSSFTIRRILGTNVFNALEDGAGAPEELVAQAVPKLSKAERKRTKKAADQAALALAKAADSAYAACAPASDDMSATAHGLATSSACNPSADSAAPCVLEATFEPTAGDLSAGLKITHAYVPAAPAAAVLQSEHATLASEAVKVEPILAGDAHKKGRSDGRPIFTLSASSAWQIAIVPPAALAPPSAAEVWDDCEIIPAAEEAVAPALPASAAAKRARNWELLMTPYRHVSRIAVFSPHKGGAPVPLELQDADEAWVRTAAPAGLRAKYRQKGAEPGSSATASSLAGSRRGVRDALRSVGRGVARALRCAGKPFAHCCGGGGSAAVTRE
ncbi:hypothetical protein WJX81_002129 [Elliptochloris bilobata]|uniref:Uncharacterized protein n=1 Tax=Elliptochloris bilobata TaxID=381761 RepID=A0AAW1SHM1_9CHLO